MRRVRHGHDSHRKGQVGPVETRALDGDHLRRVRLVHRIQQVVHDDHDRDREADQDPDPAHFRQNAVVLHEDRGQHDEEEGEDPRRLLQLDVQERQGLDLHQVIADDDDEGGAQAQQLDRDGEPDDASAVLTQDAPDLRVRLVRGASLGHLRRVEEMSCEPEHEECACIHRPAVDADQVERVRNHQDDRPDHPICDGEHDSPEAELGVSVLFQGPVGVGRRLVGELLRPFGGPGRCLHPIAIEVAPVVAASALCAAGHLGLGLRSGTALRVLAWVSVVRVLEADTALVLPLDGVLRHRRGMRGFPGEGGEGLDPPPLAPRSDGDASCAIPRPRRPRPPADLPPCLSFADPSSGSRGSTKN
mmetsp:Transcript_28434/g.69319  ORF Transcript_28434/g.69319 Transcript_28434/m.69319 type:complete len:360 (+) Transcript_28434:824-1903(+)